MITFNTDNMVQQEFPLPAPIMDYILKNLSAAQLLKLYKTCKFYYDKFRLNIIEDFEITCEEDVQRIVGNSLVICLDNPAWSKLNNLWISKSFTYFTYIDADLPLENDHQKFARLTYKSLTIYGILSVSDYEFLIKPPTIRHLFVDGAIVSHALEFLSIEDIIERAPHVSAFDLHDVSFPTVNMAKLISLERQTKLQSLHLRHVSKIPNALRVVEFFKKHATPNIDYYFNFWNDEENVKTFFKAVDDGLRAWKTLQLPPTISSSFIDLTGKLALITACDGIGKATAILFRQLGASVVVFSRNRIELKNLVEECQSIENDGSLHTRHVEDLRPYYVFKIFDYKFGSKIDILINYCDIFGFDGVPNMKSEEKFRTERFVIRTRSILTDCAKPYLMAAKGTMINVTNPHDLIVDPKEAAFIAKCELNIKNDEAELLRDGVRINNIDSGAPVTSLPRPDGMSDFDFKKLLERTQKTHEQQIAKDIAFLAFDSQS